MGFVRRTCLFLVLVGFLSSAQAQVLVEEKGRPVSQSNYDISSSGHGLRKVRRVGIGFSAAGAYGLAGTQLEFNLTPEMGVIVGYGKSRGFDAFNMQVKKVLAGDWLMPYITVGVARWFSTGSGREFNSSTPGFLSQRFLSQRERATGKFSQLMLYPSVGVQFLKLEGDWTGFSLYAEAMLMVALDDLVSAGNAGLGVLYYF